MLDATIDLRLGTLHLDVDLHAAAGEVVALVGPNGAGKTTALRALAGLQPLDRGRITLAGTVLDDVSTGTFVPPHQRSIGVAFQDDLLFPRLSARDNVAFGLRARGAAKDDARRVASGWLERVGLGGVSGSRPRELSGGQRQRVALARALATEPTALLLDEPLAAVDVQARAGLRRDLRHHLGSFDGVTVLVTHEVVDAAGLADRLVVLESGRATQTGTIDDIAARPASAYAAELVGINLLDATRAGDHVARLGSGAELTVADALADGDVAIVIRPQAVALHRARPDGSARNAWEATVAALEGGHDRVRVRLDGPVPLTAEITPAAVADLALRPGDRVWASVKAVDLVAHPR